MAATPARAHIVVDDLRIGWGTRVLMEHVTFNIERGTTFAILGGSGCGKSTLLRHLIGLERPQGGRIDIEGVGEPHRYDDGSTFINWSAAGQMQRVDESGESLWKMNSGAGFAFGFHTSARTLYPADARTH